MLQARTGYNFMRSGAPSSPQPLGLAWQGQVLARRRWLVLLLNAVTVGCLAASMAYLLSFGEWSLLKVAMLLAFATTLPWLSIGFWNAIIGSFVLAQRNARKSDPLRLDHPSDAQIQTRTAIVMALRNEDAEKALTRLRCIYDDIEAEDLLQYFDFHILSDTNKAEISKQEERLVASWRATASAPNQIFYRQRSENIGYKAGNLEEFCQRKLGDYEFFLPLDADSFMSAKAIRRLVCIMQEERDIGILQSLVVGAPAKSMFARVFQFGMRQGMRAYTAGSAWWQGDCGPYWGHNALIRMRPFHDHCRLPVLPGKGPLGGHIMSHDQVEAVLMRRGGYHVRVLVEEGESWEENPPTLVEFIKRDLRWCQGNMQYWQLLGMPGIQLMSRVQLALAILMYLGAIGWMSFLFMGLHYAVTAEGLDDYPVWHGAGLFALVLLMSLMPKLVGLSALVADRKQSAQYGGRARVLVSGTCELVFSTLLAPIVSFAVSIFMIGLMFGRRLEWRPQDRGMRNLTWREAAVKFAPQTMFGIFIVASLSLYAPAVLPWAMPVVAAFVLSIPFAVVTASERAGRWSRDARLCDIPEDVSPPAPLARLEAGQEWRPRNARVREAALTDTN